MPRSQDADPLAVAVVVVPRLIEEPGLRPIEMLQLPAEAGERDVRRDAARVPLELAPGRRRARGQGAPNFDHRAFELRDRRIDDASTSVARPAMFDSSCM